MGLLNVLGKAAAKVLDTATIALAHPIKTATAVVSSKSTLKEVTAEHFAQPLSKQITQTILGTAGIAATIAGGAAIATASKAGTLGAAAKTLIPTTLKGKAIAAVAAPVVLGAVVKEPVKTAKAVTSAPAALANVGSNVAGLIAEPSIEKAKALFTENPIIVGGAVAVAAIAGAKTLIPAITTSRQIEATQEQTAAIKEATAGITVIDKSGQFGTAPTTPTLPATQEIKEGVSKPSTRRKKRSSKAVMPSVRQNVSVIVQNRSTSTGINATKRYLNKEVLIS